MKAKVHSYVFRRIDGAFWYALTFVQSATGQQATYVDQTYTGEQAIGVAEMHRNEFCRFERKRQAREQAIIDFERNYKDAA